MSASIVPFALYAAVEIGIIAPVSCYMMRRRNAIHWDPFQKADIRLSRAWLVGQILLLLGIVGTFFDNLRLALGSEATSSFYASNGSKFLGWCLEGVHNFLLPLLMTLSFVFYVAAKRVAASQQQDLQKALLGTEQDNPQRCTVQRDLTIPLAVILSVTIFGLISFSCYLLLNTELQLQTTDGVTVWHSTNETGGPVGPVVFVLSFIIVGGYLWVRLRFPWLFVIQVIALLGNAAFGGLPVGFFVANLFEIIVWVGILWADSFLLSQVDRWVISPDCLASFKNFGLNAKT